MSSPSRVVSHYWLRPHIRDPANHVFSHTHMALQFQLFWFRQSTPW